jgi:RNA polymerase sigma-70 factor (ECF subfamily)
MLGEEFPAVLGAALQGDETAFERLYQDAHPPLLRYLRSLARDVAEDAANETWLELARRGFDGPETAFRAWLFSVARHKVIDHVRREARRPARPSTEQELEPHATPLPDVADAVVEDDVTQRTLALVRQLPPDQAEAVLLRVMAGLDYAEVAAVMDRSTGAVPVLVHRGLARLRESVPPTRRSQKVTP